MLRFCNPFEMSLLEPLTEQEILAELFDEAGDIVEEGDFQVATITLPVINIQETGEEKDNCCQGSLKVFISDEHVEDTGLTSEPVIQVVKERTSPALNVLRNSLSPTVSLDSSAEDSESDYRRPQVQVARKRKKGSVKIENQEKRLKGEAYTGFRKTKSGKYKLECEKSSRTLGPRCIHKMEGAKSDRSFLCATITDEKREEIFSDFWKLNCWEAKQEFVKSMADTREPIRRRPSSPRKNKKHEGHDCFLKNAAGSKVRVCRQFFLSTIEIKRDSFMRWIRNDKLHTGDVDENELMENASEEEAAASGIKAAPQVKTVSKSSGRHKNAAV